MDPPWMSMDPLVKPSVDKMVLTNYIRHAGSHNKVQEEREMWRQRGLQLRSQHEPTPQRQRGAPLVRGRLVSDTLSPLDEEPHSYHWTRQLMKAEENDPFRWGHSGYKELHPEEFVSTDEDSSSEKRVHKKRKKSKKEKSKREKSKREKGSKKRRRTSKDESEVGRRRSGSREDRKSKKQHRPQDSDTGDSSEDCVRKRKRHKRYSDTESDSEDYSCKRKKHTAARSKKSQQK